MIDRNKALKAAETANHKFGQWMPQAWLEKFIEAYNAENPTLEKRPVAFRLPEHDGWIILQSEDAARIEADHRSVDYQGLYVRDGAVA